MTISGAVMQSGQALSPDGALYVKLDNGSAITGTTITATTQFISANGSNGTPAYRGTTIAASGMYFGGDNSEVVLFTDNGTAVAGIYNGGGGIQVLQSLGLVWPTTLGSAAFDLAISRKAAGIISFDSTALGNGLAALSLSERTAPSAPASNGVYIYAQDNGAGKTQLMALFASGAAQQIAIEP